jgi:hypothetical protein
MANRDTDYDDQVDEPVKPQPEDNDTPFSEPADSKHRLPEDHPVKDDPVDSQEAYDEGEDDAANDNDPDGERPAGPRAQKMF